jgi:hypothetical protein
MARAAHIVKRDSFSLVELLVVVAIVALLAALVLPGLARAREYAYFTKCKGHMRQISLGFLTFAADNRGKIPRGESPCGGGDSGVAGPHASLRRIGYGYIKYVGHYADLSPGLGALGRRVGGSWSASIDDKRGFTILEDVYGGPLGCGQNWLEDISGSTTGPWVSYPRRPGKYLPIDILFDPIVIVRQWKPWGAGNNSGGGAFTYYTYDSNPRGQLNGVVVDPGTAFGRDKMARNGAIFGYEFFTFSVGCIKNKHFKPSPWPTAWGGKAKFEQPYRYATSHKDVIAHHKPSVWIAACCRPFRTYRALKRDFVGHFGHRRTVPATYKFNVLHLDGHVDDQLWLEYLPECDDWFFERYSDGNLDSVYGWRFKDTSGTNWQNGLEMIPGFPLAFDENG